ncbi:MAG TPA: hypothetical protein VJS12_13025 [Steroidobacteraceae bacterium]|nr:hypothetical protein [Steroidobacteraceae bacterium]
MRAQAILFAVLCFGSGSAGALYNPAPDAGLAAVQGEWTGTLTYRDYEKPDKMVTLPTKLFIALGAPNELVLHFAYDDGPSKTVYSYERMQFDFSAKQLTWSSLGDEDPPTKCRISEEAQEQPAGRRMTCEQADKGKVERYELVLTPQRLTISKEEIDAAGKSVLRNRYQFSRK